MNNKPTFWDKNSEVQVKPLRQPKFFNQNTTVDNSVKVSTSRPPATADLPKQQSDLVAKSVLKADAPEWYPQSFMNQHVETLSHSVQNRLKIHRNDTSNSRSSSSLGSQFNPGQIPNQNVVENNQSTAGTNGENPDIKRLKQIVSTLTKDPGQFDNLFEIFMDTLMPHLGDILFLANFTKLLVEQAIINPNFRYSGAKLCWHIEQYSPEFRAELHLMCKKKLDNNNVTQDFLLFIAELYTQLSHLEVYGILLIDCYKYLLQKGDNNDNIKCICQALKLTGYTLEKTNQNDLNNIFEELYRIKSQVSGSVFNLLDSVLRLRQANWGHSTEESTDSEQDFDQFGYESSEQPVFYQQDGNMLTNEECDFIAAHEEYLSDVSNPDDLCDPEPEMDEEIQEAFKEFIKFSSKP